MERLQLCRLCLHTYELGFSLFTNDIAATIESLTAIKVAPDDGLPSNCCNVCLIELQRFYKFLQKAKSADRVLHDMARIYAERESTALETLQVQDTPACNNTNETMLLRNAVDTISGDNTVQDDDDNDDDDDDGYSQISEIVDENLSQAYDTQESSQKKNPLKSDNNNNTESGVTNDSLKNTKKNCTVDDSTTIAGEKLVINCPSPKQSLCCNICNEIFNCKYKWHLHMRSHAKENCPLCQVMIRSDNINKHLAIHGKCIVSCNFCGKKLKNKASLRSHIHYNHKNFPPVKCHVCNKELKNDVVLKDHLERLHLGFKRVQCYICAKTFSQKSNLRRHIQTLHKQVVQYSCHICKKEFSNKYDRKKHILEEDIHKVSYICEYCGKEFQLKTSLTAHLNSAHK